jgi:F-type H+-transporting ATPase subunit b
MDNGETESYAVLIDWFTVAAQIVNFLILVALLRYFLYGRIKRAMHERQQRIAAHLEEAEHRRQEADEQAASYQQKHQELEAQRAELMAQVRAEADAKRQELFDQARADLDRTQTRWQEALRREQAAFLRDLRQRTAQQVYATARRALTDLAGVELEHHILSVFLERLQGLDAQAWETLTASPQDVEPSLLIRSTFDLPHEARQRLLALLRKHLGKAVDVRFETSPDVLCGIEMQTNGQKIAWSLEHYLEGLEEQLSATLEAATRHETEADKSKDQEEAEHNHDAGA